MALREDRRSEEARRTACSLPAQSSRLQLGTWLSLCCAAVCLLSAKPSAFGHKPQKCHSVQLSQGAECPPSPSTLTLCAEDGHVVLLGRWGEHWRGLWVEERAPGCCWGAGIEQGPPPLLCCYKTGMCLLLFLRSLRDIKSKRKAAKNEL